MSIRNYDWPSEETAIQAWEILYEKCKIPLKQRMWYRRETLPNGIKAIYFGAWIGISNHPEVYDPMADKEEMWILDMENAAMVVGKVTSDKKFIRYPERWLT
jgi:hypothetical protein